MYLSFQFKSNKGSLFFFLFVEKGKEKNKGSQPVCEGLNAHYWSTMNFYCKLC